MNTVEIKITSSGLENNQAQFLANFLTSLNVGTGALTKKPEALNAPLPEVEETKTEELVSEKTSRTRAKKEKPTQGIEQPAEETKMEVVEDEQPATEEEDESPEITIKQIRDAFQPKISTHRDKLKAKLTELGASSVTLLDTKHYASFLEFVNGL